MVTKGIRHRLFGEQTLPPGRGLQTGQLNNPMSPRGKGQSIAIDIGFAFEYVSGMIEIVITSFRSRGFA